MEAQVLDSNPIERERGITIKAQSRLAAVHRARRQDLPAELHRHARARRLQLRSLALARRLRRRAAGGRRRAGRRGAVGRQLLHRGRAGPGSRAGANKIDLPTADIETVKKEIEAVIGIDADDAVAISAKTGLNVDRRARSDRRSAFRRRSRATRDRLQALIIDSWFDNYLGVVSLVRVMQGEIKPGDKILVMSTGRTHQVDKRRRVHAQAQADLTQLGAGEVGWVNAVDQGRARRAGRRHADARRRSGRRRRCRVSRRCSRACSPACSRSMPTTIRRCAKRWKNSRSTTPRCTSSPKVSEAMGFGFRCGFLGMLHMEIVQERLEREYDLNLITTAPTVVYEVLQDRRHRHAAGQPGQAAAGQPDRGNPRADHPRQHPDAAGLRRQRDHPVRGKTRLRSSASSTWAARCRSATSCRWPKSCWTSSTG